MVAFVNYYISNISNLDKLIFCDRLCAFIIARGRGLLFLDDLDDLFDYAWIFEGGGVLLDLFAFGDGS